MSAPFVLLFMLSRSLAALRVPSLTFRVPLKTIRTMSKAKANGATKTTEASRQGIMMILSPAKTLDFSPDLPLENLDFTLPTCCPEKTDEIAKAMKKMSADGELTKLLKLSANLASKTNEYWNRFALDGDGAKSNSKPCIYAYSGAAYQGLQASECDKDSIDYLQRNLRILDAVYGVLRPLDQIQPYRLELNSKVFKDTKLSTYWSEPVTRSLADSLGNNSDGSILLNLASDEYSAAVNTATLPKNCRYIKVLFWEDGRVVTIHTKRARGLMARYLADQQVNTVEGILDFAAEGYKFVESESNDTTLVFDRKKQPKPAASKRSSKATAKAKSSKRSKR